METCDPLGDDCEGENEACYLAYAQFYCHEPEAEPWGDGELQQLRDACHVGHSCEPGLLCAHPEVDLRCEEGGWWAGCCLQPCDLRLDPEEDVCAEEDGERCVPAVPRASDEVAHVGICVLEPGVARAG